MKTNNFWLAPALFIVSGILQYLGASVAVGLFAQMVPAAVAWWRLAIGGLFLLLMWRPWKQSWTLRNLLVSGLFGVFLGAMNILFYEAIAHLPLGVAVSVEFLGPVAVAVLRGRGKRVRVAAVLALIGVLLIGGIELDLRDMLQLLGLVFALGAAAMWAGYIVLGQSIASKRSGVASLAVGCCLAALLFAPFLASAAFSPVFSWSLVAALVGVGILSTALPYSFEAVVLKRLSASTFALLTALLPATSTLVGAVALNQIPGLAELGGLCAISLAVWLASKNES